MKTFQMLLTATLILTASEGFARLCDKDKKGDIADCISALRASYDRNSGQKQFTKDFDEVCQTNSKFKCTKVTVMGDLSKTQKEYQADPDHRNATIFKIDSEDGKYLYLFEKK